MHVPTVVYRYIIQASRLPSMTQHSPSLLADDLNTTDEQQRQEYNIGGQQRKTLLLQVQHPKATNLHLLVAMAE